MIVFLHWIWNDYDAIHDSCLAMGYREIPKSFNFPNGLIDNVIEMLYLCFEKSKFEWTIPGIMIPRWAE